MVGAMLNGVALLSKDPNLGYLSSAFSLFVTVENWNTKVKAAQAAADEAAYWAGVAGVAEEIADEQGQNASTDTKTTTQTLSSECLAPADPVQNAEMKSLTPESTPEITPTPEATISPIPDATSSPTPGVTASPTPSGSHLSGMQRLERLYVELKKKYPDINNLSYEQLFKFISDHKLSKTSYLWLCARIVHDDSKMYTWIWRRRYMV